MAHRTVLQYELGERIGAGGMGEIYKARDTRLNRFVAMKALSAGMAADPDRRLRFIQEAQAVSALNHPNIITIYDIIDDGENQYMVVEYVDGKTLLELIPKGGLPVPQVIRYASQIAEALCAAHAAGIIHRDLKPANVMITGSGLVKVLDFGLAKLIDWPAADPDGATVTMIPSPLTIQGALLGTVNYMSPEQAEGRKIDARSDIFSFGAVLYEMLTGQSAFRGNSIISTLSAVLRDDIQPLGELTPGTPPELERIVVECLKKDPDQRVQSMREVQTVFAALRQQSDSAVVYDSPAASMAMSFPPIRRRRVPPARATIFVLILAVIVAGAGYWWMTGHRSVPLPGHTRPSTSAGILANHDIVALVAASVPPQVIINQIRNSKTNFNLSAPEVIRLSNAGVPAAVIEVMRNPHQIQTAVSAAPALPSPAPVPVTLTDGLPVLLILTADIPSDAAEGDPVHLKVASDLSVDDAVVIRKGAVATGTITDARKKVFGIGGKMTFRLDKVDAVDGQKVPIRVTPELRDGSSKRPVETDAKKPKGMAAAAGTVYTGYIDGAKTVLVKK